MVTYCNTEVTMMTTMDAFAHTVPWNRWLLGIAVGLVTVAASIGLLLASPTSANLTAATSDCAPGDRVCQLAESATWYLGAR